MTKRGSIVAHIIKIIGNGDEMEYKLREASNFLPDDPNDTGTVEEMDMSPEALANQHK